MSRYQDLPIYRDCYQLMLEIYTRVRKLDRDYKYSVGQELRAEITALTLLIFRANVAQGQGRAECLGEAQERVETARLLIRLLRDVRQISLKSFTILNTQIETVSKQLLGWKRNTTARIAEHHGAQERAEKVQ